MASLTDSTAPAPRTIPTRRISFEDSLRDLNRHFVANGDLVMSHAVAVLSSVFPDGEDFFVRSVRNFRDEITDPELRRQVNGFIGQEATHGREHRAVNRRLAELGYPTRRTESFTRRGLAARTRFLSPASNLAATAALEHFTATLAELLLTDERLRADIGEGPVLDVLEWHALEESEHKAVAFDVYVAVGGGERLRTMTMNLTTVGFIVGMTAQTALSLLGDPATFERGRLRESLGRLRRAPYLDRELWRRLREYNRRGFHPEDRDTTELVRRWREELFGDDGRLRGRLA